VGETFGARHQELAAGAGELNGLAATAGELLARVRQALSGAAGAAGSDDLAKALMETDVLNARRMAELDVLYGHIGDSLAETAKGYQSTDSGAAARIQAAGKRAS
jgi:uncharacterized protein YukE